MSGLRRGYAVFFRSCGARSATPQLQLPIFPDRVTHITNQLALMRQDGQVTYFNGHMPVFSHAETDIATFRMITSQFCVAGHVKQSDIIRAFGVTSISVKRSVKIYHEKGPKGFYAVVKRFHCAAANGCSQLAIARPRPRAWRSRASREMSFMIAKWCCLLISPAA
jgi:hypothetical protein